MSPVALFRLCARPRAVRIVPAKPRCANDHRSFDHAIPSLIMESFSRDWSILDVAPPVSARLSVEQAQCRSHRSAGFINVRSKKLSGELCNRANRRSAKTKGDRSATTISTAFSEMKECLIE